MTKTIWTNFCSRVLRSLQMKFEFNWPSGLRREDVWKCWWTDKRQTGTGVTGILLAQPWAFCSGELKKTRHETVVFLDEFYFQVNRFGHVQIVSSASHTFSWANLTKQDWTGNPWICSQTRYHLPMGPLSGAVWSEFTLFAIPSIHCLLLSRDMWFPTMWHFDKCRLRWACAASF